MMEGCRATTQEYFFWGWKVSKFQKGKFFHKVFPKLPVFSKRRFLFCHASLLNHGNIGNIYFDSFQPQKKYSFGIALKTISGGSI